MSIPSKIAATTAGAGSRWLALAVSSALLVACGSDGVGPTTSDQESSTAPSEAANPEAAFGDGDTVTLVVPFAAGGGFDLYTRFVQPCVEEALQEVTGSSVSVLVENVEGGGGQVAAEQVFRAPADGTRLLISSQDILNTQQIIEGAEYDVREMTVIAQIAQISLAVMVREGVIPEGGDFTDLVERSQEEPILWGGSGLEITQKLLFHYLAEGGNEIQVDTVEFEGTSEAIASMLREELEVYFVTLPTAIQQAEANPEVRVIAATAASVPEGVDVPTLTELGISNADEIAAAAGGSTRIFVGPPDMDASAASALRTAFEDALTDSDCVDEANEAGYPITYAPADEAEQALEEGFDLIEASRDILTE